MTDIEMIQKEVHFFVHTLYEETDTLQLLQLIQLEVRVVSILCGDVSRDKINTNPLSGSFDEMVNQLLHKIPKPGSFEPFYSV